MHMGMSVSMNMNMGVAPVSMAYGGVPTNPMYNGMVMGGPMAQTFLPAYAVGGEPLINIAASVPL